MPVISVGNLSAGGTGKTPVTLALAQILQEPPYGRKVAVLSRGYRRKSKSYQLVSSRQGSICPWEVSGDESQLLARRLPGVPVAVDKDRVHGAAILLQTYSPQAVLLDDGFQHRRLHRDLDLVLLDSACDLSDRMLPLGLLREPLSSLRRAHLIALQVISRDAEEFEKNWQICVERFGAERLLAYGTKPSNCIELRTGSRVPLESLSGLRLIPFCGIAKPENFLNTLLGLGAEIPFLIRYRDHHRYSTRDVERLATAYARKKPRYLITTEKDAVKLEGLFTALPILVLQIDVEWRRGLENLQRELNRIFADRREKSP